MHPNANPNDARMRELLMRHLAQRGFETLAAGDGRELDRQLSRNHVDPIVLDLIVLDLMLPGEDGLSICRRLRGQVAETPIVRPVRGALGLPAAAMLRAPPLTPCQAELWAQDSGWRLRVFDRGPGVPEAALGDLGRPFHRIDRARGTSGSGLGLASVARIAGVHGGSLRLGNREGGGLVAEVFFCAPLP